MLTHSVKTDDWGFRISNDLDAVFLCDSVSVRGMVFLLLLFRHDNNVKRLEEKSWTLIRLIKTVGSLLQ